MLSKGPKPAEVLAETLLKATARPTLGEMVHVRSLQDRALLYALSPGTGELMYFAGKDLGAADARHGGITAKDLREALQVYEKDTLSLRLARTEMTNESDREVVIRMHECAASYGLPNMGLKVCSFDAGVQAGFLSQALGKRVVSTEVKCNANGDAYCEFNIRVLDTPEAAFAEAFKF